MDQISADRLIPDLDRLRARVRGDQRITSAPMLVFGALIVLYALLGGLAAGQLGAGGRHSTLLFFWPLATIAGLVALWRWERRRAARLGVGAGRHSYRTATKGYLVALAVIVVLGLPILFVGVFTPMIWPAAVLATLAGWHRDRVLGIWAGAIGVLGGAASFALLAQADVSERWWWLQASVWAALGLALIVGGRVIGRGERAAS
jgi:hypothetical protein